ncbi:30S ribosomal protein S17 [Candidatus Adlerbacteria bacterium RIFCSPHIGHO2_01_FULL_54_23]|uniref:Small ribosomal subunit protein uS17 n=3 Tax=Candidatus Adleribacteriota TaxID=1752736 RepID=A0A1F4Y0M4_9BACT|nr:MAG: 30S ribosomal protein S17 [Candidatus Adlerbacteria bacterium GW2011_GWA1_54_10]KKW36187.1 MAG: 30S ribosomal protein S17 [Candidatus Adlerbacteria bacterium GW2011_GWA2_54_12]KKW37321.1 MAG: 30S ribosomal protein S17 [Candidatus Adlerbacteria bacterium GW2011_GWB1_54_7]OGC78994.1 MAG: 30S ribosomal protein S17 [Candidatus Adlerbacteria bacterium RIFCSPHIGHO2_01_FULL_54_23]OGC87434.1 MAG: 30S ribosomal protein S17 [Candidatus Adlerbacteria bacterium RIFCSPLOWO2_01_FULL_54_16]
METKLKEFKGVVVSDKMQSTAVVAVSRYVKHPKYKKYMKKTTRLMAHNAGGRAKVGDKVTVRSCRPLSKTKHFEIVFEQ